MAYLESCPKCNSSMVATLTAEYHFPHNLITPNKVIACMDCGYVQPKQYWIEKSAIRDWNKR